MITLRFAELKRQKALRERRDLTLRTMAAETGLGLNTIHRLNKGEAGRVYLSTLDVLCGYFEISEVGELLQYAPDPPGTGPMPRTAAAGDAETAGAKTAQKEAIREEAAE